MTDFTNSDPPADATDELLELLDALYPDPVDVFQDELAARLGFVRHPTCSLEEWRRLRVRLIDATDACSDEESRCS